jgi:hypothetical protein
VGGLRDGRALSPVMGGGGGWVEQGQEGLPAIYCREQWAEVDGSRRCHALLAPWVVVR